MAEKARAPQARRAPDGDAGGCLVEARGLVRSFGQTPALRGASVSVAAGEILASMGPSGSGKSTLLHCLADILTPDAGEVWFGGRRVDTMGESERSALRRERFGFVFQFGQLVPELTAEENVALPLLLDGTDGRRRSQKHGRGSGGWVWKDANSTGPGNCPAGRLSVSRWPAGWSTGRRSCSRTSRPDPWTRSPASTS